MGNRATTADIEKHLRELRDCSLCPNMIGPVIVPRPVISKVYLIGQAPGPREGNLGRPFAWTAGKRMFGWFEQLGLNEEEFRSRAYISAVCRCFPGKAKGGGDRVPSPDEIERCSQWMQREIDMLQPELVIPVGRLAIEQILLSKSPLVEVIGKQFRTTAFGATFDLIALPHPSGASTWHYKDPGKALLAEALQLIGQHPAWIKLKNAST
jgi:uracil-DNA glycosylase